ncbi:ABC transporter permease [Anaerocolumna aminovalerica]|uniref:Peptide/nickel transport system permease protein n=1 Tax=Anaerocolumna aminovalerica TaxID=1527 RepID=A0A1I5H0W2_9FIRM|nr:ABC transporter permease [Anaerocolumna aminovalerica]MDU6265916.1 ABC transporter permease [Anaerocolumna aminovalerica]SFO41845.1 peptide/nickel transport system permease protein [Anaerocolumna aminovalerica]
MKNKKINNLNFKIGISIISLVLLFIIIGLFYTPYDPNAMDGTAKNMAPGFTHLFGTDNFGRDVLSRVMEGGRTTFFVALLTVAIGAFFGTLVGAFTGYYGGWLDEILMRINDGVASFPSILLALIVVSLIGPGKYNVIIALGIIFIPSFARVVRSEYITLKERDFVKNAKLMGASDLRIMFVHILPNTKAILLSSLTIGFNNAVLAEAGMSYLQLGVQPPDPSLGRMLSEAQSYMFMSPWCAIFPGIMIVLSVIGFSLINER